MQPAQHNFLQFRYQITKGRRTSAVKGVIRLSVLSILVAFIGAFIYSSSHASSGNWVSKQQVVPAGSGLPVYGDFMNARGNHSAFDYSTIGFFTALPFQVPPLTIEESTCTTLQATFNLGDQVCITVAGSQFLDRRVVVTDPQNLIRQDTTISTSPQVGSYLIPTSPTTPLSGGFVNENNLGTWHVFVVTGRGGKLATGQFVVKDPSQATVNVEITTDRPGGDLITAGSTVTYDITLVNFGPDAAANAKFTNPTPAFTSFQSVTIPGSPSGITCTDPGVNGVGNVTCTIPSLPADTRVNFVVQYLVDNVGAGSSIENTANLTTDTANISGATSASSSGNTSSNGTPSGCTLTCPANITVTADTTGPNPVDPSQTVPGANVSFAIGTDGTCGSVSSSPASGSFFPVGTTVVTSSSSEGGGECSFTVTVTQSGGAVSISCPANVTANADANCSAVVNLGTPTTTGDNVTVNVTRSDGQPMYDCDANGNNCVRKSQDLPFPAGVTMVTWSASNSSGTESCTQTVTVYDVTPPTIGAGNDTVAVGANCQAAVPDYSGTVSDNCACSSSDTSSDCAQHGRVSVTQDPAPGTMVGLGQYPVHITANDGSVSPGPDGILGTPDDVQGNVTEKTITLTVVDNTPPTITPPANVTAYTGPGATTCDTVVDPGTATASDNCSVSVSRSPSGNTFPVGTTTITWTATDGSGNSTTATQTVTVIDNTPPVISCPASITLEPTCPSGAIANYPVPVGTDNCAGATTSRTAGLASGSVFPIGTTTVAYTVTDHSGNSASCSFTVTVKTAAQTVQDMMVAVQALQPPLSGTQVQGLNAKLQAALDAINQGKTNVACNKLSDFISQVTAFLNNGTLTSAQGTPLITSANHVRNTIGCTNNGCS